MKELERLPKLIRAVTVDDSLSFIEPSIDKLKSKFKLSILSSPGTNIDRICEQYDIIGHRVYMYRRLSPLTDLISLCRLVKLFATEKPHIVHSMTPKAGLLCMMAAWITRVPRRIHTFTGLVWPTESGFIRRILMVTDWLTCTCATHIIPEGFGVKHDLHSYITKKSMRVLGYGNVKGVDMRRCSRRPEVMELANALREDSVFTFIFVGRIVSDKGINELVSAFTELSNKYNAVRLFLVGNSESDIDPISSNTQEKIDNNKAIYMVGPKYDDELLGYYAASDCFVFPSYREGFPNTVLEAGAMELPSIVTDINGSREIIKNGFNGLVIPAKNSDALHDAMESMLLRKSEINKMGANARILVEERFNQNYVQQCLLDFYEEVII